MQLVRERKVFWKSGQCIALAAFCSIGATTHDALADVESEECLQQMEDLTRTSVACEIRLDLDEPARKELMFQTNNVLSNVECAMPLAFPKSDIYGGWITDGQIALPNLHVLCQLVGTVQGIEQRTPVQTNFMPICTKQEADWRCEVNMHGTEGIGVLVRPLERTVNENEEMKEEMARFLRSLSES